MGVARRTRLSSALRAFTGGVAIVVVTSTLTAPPGRADVTGPVITHTPVTVAPYGRPIPITATSNCAVGAVCSARVYYRTTAPAALLAVPGIVGEGGFAIVGMSPTRTTVEGQDAVTWSGEIPAGAATTQGVDYFVEVDHNGARTVFPGTTTADTVQPVGTYLHIHVLSPPLINHEPVPIAFADQPFNVDAQVSCSSGNCTATLHFRKRTKATDPRDFNSVRMDQQGPGTSLGDAAVLASYRGTVPGSFVDTMGLDYWIHVTDGHTNAYHPGTTYEGWYAPRDGHQFGDYLKSHRVHVLEAPHITHVPIATATYRQDIPIVAQANCPPTRQCYATLYYRTTPFGLDLNALQGINTGFTSAAMTVTRLVAGTDPILLQGVIPGAVADTRGVDYFFSVTEGTTTTWWPGTSVTDAGVEWVDGMRVAYQHVRVLEPPHLHHVPPTVAPAGEDLVIDAELTCATEACSATLFYSPPDPTLVTTTFQAVGMDRVAVVDARPASRVEVWRAVIPASAVTTRGVAYHMTATDGYTNTAAPGTFYWGAYIPIDGFNPAPQTVHFVARVVDPPHPVHVPVGAAFTGEPIPIEAKANCAYSCPATLHYRVTGQAWQSTGMTPSAPLANAYGNDILSYTAEIPGSSVSPAGVEYRIEITDGFVTETTPTYPVVGTARPVTTSTLPPVTTTSVPLPPTTTTSVQPPPVTTTTVQPPPVTTTTVQPPPVTTTTVPLPPTTTTTVQPPPVTTTSTSVPLPPTTTTSVPVPQNRPPSAATIVNPPDGEVFTDTEAQLFTITATDPDGDAYTGLASFTNLSTNVTTSIRTSAAPSGVSSSGTPVPPLPPGSYTWAARATDAKGLNGPESTWRSFTVVGPSGPPPPGAPNVVAPANGKVFLTGEPQTFVLTVPNPAVATYTGVVTVRHASSGAVATTVATSATAWGLPSSGTALPPLPTGSYTFTARLTLQGGGDGPESPSRSFTVAEAVANSAPGLPTLVAPGAGAMFGATDAQLFTINALDPDGDPYTGTVSITNTATGATTSVTTSPALSAGNSQGAPAVPLSAGTYTWRARATDAKGASGQWSATRTVTVAGGAPAVPRASVVVFTTPVQPAAPGQSVTMRIQTATAAGQPLGSAAVRWGAGAPESTPSYPNLVTTNGDGVAQFNVVMDAVSPLVRVVAHVDHAGAGSGAPDPTEPPGAALLVRNSGVTPPPGTVVVFETPVAAGPPGTPQNLALRAVTTGGAAFTGRVRWGAGAPESPLAFPNDATTDNDGKAIVTVTPSPAQTILRIVAYADAPGAGFGSRGDNEVVGVATSVSSALPPVPSGGTAVVFDNPVVTAPPGVGTSVPFIAVSESGFYVGKVQWVATTLTGTQVASGTADARAPNGTGFVSVIAGTSPIQVVAYADRANAGFGVREITAVPGSAVVIGTNLI